MVEYHKTGAKLFIQLTAGFGRAMAVNEMMEKINNNKVLNVLAKPLLNVDFLCASCSPTPNRWSDKIKTKELTQKQIHKFVEAFAKISKLCKEAGVDGVEVHAVHDKLIDVRCGPRPTSCPNQLALAIEEIEKSK